MMPPSVAYVLRTFPKLSETFIANEILGLERSGLPLRIYSAKRSEEAVPHQLIQEIRSPIEYLPDTSLRAPRGILNRWAVGRAAHVARRLEPGRYDKAERYAQDFTTEKGVLLKAAHLALRLRANPVRHLRAHWADATTLTTMLASMLSGIPFSFSSHAKDMYTAPPADLKRKIDQAQFVITCSGAGRDYLESIVEPAQREKIRLIYHGVDVAKFCPSEDALAESPPVILSVARLVEKKGLDDLLRACALLRARGRSFRCVIIGEGPEKASLERLSQSLGLADIVEIPGARSQEEVLDAYRRATVFALPCRILENGDRDGIPNVLLEAMATELPVVATGVSGIPELVHHGENGLLAEERDAPGLAAAIERLLIDEGLRRQLAEAGRDSVVRNFDSRAHVGDVVELMTGPLSGFPGLPADSAEMGSHTSRGLA